MLFHGRDQNLLFKARHLFFKTVAVMFKAYLETIWGSFRCADFLFDQIVEEIILAQGHRLLTVHLMLMGASPPRCMISFSSRHFNSLA